MIKFKKYLHAVTGLPYSLPGQASALLVLFIALPSARLACRAILINRVSSAGAVDSTAISLSGMQSNSKQEIVYSAGAVDIAPLAY